VTASFVKLLDVLILVKQRLLSVSVLIRRLQTAMSRRVSTKFICLIFSIFSLFCSHGEKLSSLNARETLKLEVHPEFLICTVHLTMFNFRDYRSVDIAERIFMSNNLQNVWTVSSLIYLAKSTENKIQPIHSFFESCSINIYSEPYFGKGRTKDDEGYSVLQKLYLIRNQYISRPWKFSIVIVILNGCELSISELSFFVQHRLFFHRIGCGSFTFPNHIFVAHGFSVLPLDTEDPVRIHRRKIPCRYLDRFNAPRYAYDLERYDQNYPYCLKRPLTKAQYTAISDDPLDFCRVQFYIMQHLKLYMNFSTYPLTFEDRLNSIDKRFGKSSLGTILVSDNIIDFEIGPASIALYDTTHGSILYCDISLERSKFQMTALYSTFETTVWISVLIIVILSSAVVSLKMLNKSIHDPQKNWKLSIRLFRTFSSSCFQYYRILVENCDTYDNSLCIFFALATLILTNEYRNYATANLIVPDQPYIISNVTEIIRGEFSIWKADYSNYRHDDEAVRTRDGFLYGFGYEIDRQYRNQCMETHERWFRLARGITNVDILDYVTNSNKRVALYLESDTDFGIDYYLHKAELKNYPNPCHFIKQPLLKRYRYIYSLNPRAEEFGDWMLKFLSSGLVRHWKEKENSDFVLIRNLENRMDSLNRSDDGKLDAEMIHQSDLWGVYLIISVCILTALIALLAEYCVNVVRKKLLITCIVFLYFKTRMRFLHAIMVISRKLI
jgi:hypothetical protein